MEWMTIYNAFQPMEAQLIRARLEAAGFHPEIFHELSALSTEGYSLSIGGIQVKVPSNEVEAVQELLAAEKESNA